MWTQGTNTTGTKHTVCGSFTEENIDSIEVVSKTDGDTEVDSVTAQIRDGLFIARALNFVDGANTATKATATATDKADNTAADTNTGVDIETTLDVWYEYDASGRRTKKCEEGEHSEGEAYTEYIWGPLGRLEQADIDYGTGESPRYARAWLTWDPIGQLVKLEIQAADSQNDLVEDDGDDLVLLKKYTYFGGSVIVERDEVGTPSEKEYVAAAGAYLYQVDASDAYWYYHYDGDGSVAAITNASAAIKTLYEYDAFGSMITNAGTVDNTFGFYGGRFIDELGLLYDAVNGRFQDPDTSLVIARASHSDAFDGREGGPALVIALLAASSLLFFFSVRRKRVGGKRKPPLRRSCLCLAVLLSVGAVTGGGGCRKESRAAFPASFTWRKPWEWEPPPTLPQWYDDAPSVRGALWDEDCCRCYEYKLQEQLWIVKGYEFWQGETTGWRDVKGHTLSRLKYPLLSGWVVPLRVRVGVKTKENTPREWCCRDCRALQRIVVVYPLSDYGWAAYGGPKPSRSYSGSAYLRQPEFKDKQMWQLVTPRTDWGFSYPIDALAFAVPGKGWAVKYYSSTCWQGCYAAHWY